MEFYKSKFSDKKKSRKRTRDDEPSRSYRNSRDDRGSRYSRNDNRGDSAIVTCSDCGTECEVPFVPRTNKPVYCNDCFRDNKSQDSGRDRNDRYSRDDRGSRYSRNDNRGDSAIVTCSDCGTECEVPFVPRTNKPVYCNDCFRDNKSQDSGRDRNDRYSRDDRGSRYSRNDNRGDSAIVTCSDCGTECEVPFVPRTNKPVYCNDCFRDNKSQDSGRDRNDRYSRDDRGSRLSSRRESNRDNSKPNKPRSDKFLKKQESFYANGSDKFYETIKEKLYEILGGKICSTCGFKDERALGISPISENVKSDNSGRGGDAASWGKYISSPDLAREELRVFCLNCNQIREPITKRPENRSRPKSKKSKYFPR
ncbi:CxxC-x17-CxxC domain-containing protein [Nitrosopumilus sp.]|uniref:CxxC-x17-CxxC domain-containing protein n=1 Tax=Nitrosopumilus sp. TaxID=2024843 RepID=UPI00247DC440|nr:CxxC-x17-CxxC domain-containing protein [Nitrosopumilus sp.]MCV0431072.1 hypothetical protein [Nitrosopumilus sp.]